MVGLNALAEQFGNELFILGVPSNNFGLQEPGANSALLNCYKYVRPGDGFEPKYNITTKQDVNGAYSHELYTFLRGACPATISTKGDPAGMYWSPVDANDLNWNFEKFLIDRQGRPVRRYHPINDPSDIADDIRELMTISENLQKMEEMIPKQKSRKTKASLTDMLSDHKIKS